MILESPDGKTCRVLVVDDEPDILELVSLTLERMGLSAETASDLGSARELLASCPFDLCLTDMRLPDGDGLELVRHIQSAHREIPVAVITAHGSMETAIEALKAGAFDFVAKPVDLEVLRRLIEVALRLRSSVVNAEAETQELLLGESPSICAIRNQIGRVARTQAPVFISGESGTGKELVARMIHARGPRSAQPFVAVNCGAIPPELMESEFFGHRKGSFSGAVADKQGLFQAADGGTLFLDEVADLPLYLQVKLLRVLQEKRIRPIGAVEEIPVDVRILSATHKSLKKMVENGQFRQDLYYRIHVIGIEVPPLRERREDIPLLADHLLTRLAKQLGLPALSLSLGALERLQQYDFPGNVRELENILERAAALCETGQIEAADLGLTSSSTSVSPSSAAVGHEVLLEEGFSLEDYLEEIEKKAVLAALDAAGGNRSRAARRLGMTLRQLNYRLQKWQPD